MHLSFKLSRRVEFLTADFGLPRIMVDHLSRDAIHIRRLAENVIFPHF